MKHRGTDATAQFVTVILKRDDQDAASGKDMLARERAACGQ
jgi:hypothetical protein